MRISDWSSDVCSSDRKDLVLHAQERAGYIDIHALPKPFERHFGKRQSGLRDPRIVERAVKPAERRQSLRDKCLHVLFLCDVAPEIGGLPARRSDDRLTGLVVDVSSDARRVGKECVSTCRSRWSPYHSKNKLTR